MNGYARWSAISAVVFIGFGVLLAGTLLVGIWSDFENPGMFKATTSSFVLFFLSGVFHAVVKGLSDRARSRA